MASSADRDAAGSNSLSSIEAGVLNPAWVKYLRQKLKTEPKMLKEAAGSESCCIHRVPPALRRHEEAYTPLLVSLGPFHRSNQMLQAMEKHKWRYLDKALSRATDKGLESFLRAIKDLEKEARECYSEIIDLDSDEFVQMMVLDGCFILQFVLTATQVLTNEPNDPIFLQCWLSNGIARDMILLENQIPFCVLRRLFDLMKSSMQIRGSLVSIFGTFFKGFKLYEHSSDETPMHLLHLIQLCVLRGRRSPPGDPTVEVIPCATQLHWAGVRFECVNDQSFLDIIFEDGVLKIPSITIEDNTYWLFLNLIAFEQCYAAYCYQYVTVYVRFMNYLIDSADDVLILHRKGIIKHLLGSDAEVADLFNKLDRDVVLWSHCFYLSDIMKLINYYRSKRWHAWRVNLIQKYFYSPWAIISLIGAIILLVLTFLQTVFAVL